MKAKDIMTKKPTWLKPETNLRDIAKKMKELGTGIVSIGNGDKLLGMVTDRDITLSLADDINPNITTAADIMRKDIFYCYENDDITIVAQDMEKKQVRRLIVLDNDRSKKLVGIISLGDLATHTHDKKLCGEVVEIISKARKAA